MDNICMVRKMCLRNNQQISYILHAHLRVHPLLRGCIVIEGVATTCTC